MKITNALYESIRSVHPGRPPKVEKALGSIMVACGQMAVFCKSSDCSDGVKSLAQPDDRNIMTLPMTSELGTELRPLLRMDGSLYTQLAGGDVCVPMVLANSGDVFGVVTLKILSIMQDIDAHYYTRMDDGMTVSNVIICVDGTLKPCGMMATILGG